MPLTASATLPGPQSILPPYDEKAKETRLASMKRRATGMLAVAGLVFIVAKLLEPRYPWLGYVVAAAEASLVGGLADWFAVTALFRHPLGIPIPHTAIIPARKDKVGRNLGGFVQRNFLNRDVVAAKLRSLDAAEHLATWMSKPENARKIARQAAAGLSGAAKVLREEDVQKMIDNVLATRVRNTKVAPLLGKLLTVMTAGNRHQELLDEVIALTAKAVADHHWLIREKIDAESPWWVPPAVDDRIHQKIILSLEQMLTDIRDDSDHPLRLRFDTALHEFIDKLHSSPEVIERAETLKEDILNAAVVQRFSSSLWADAKDALLRYAEDPDAPTSGSIEHGLNAVGEAVLSDPALLEKINRAITDMSLHLVERYRHEVEGLISQTVNSWDPEATSRRIELAIGRDLQFIRINGTLVGGLAGLLLYSISQLMLRYGIGG
ncbi:MAG: DUF445 domain-containing protein [Gemmatimonadaceae bacterium]